MTDATLNTGGERPRSSLLSQDAHTKKRNRAEARFRAYGIGAILIGLFFLIVLATSIIRSGAPAFTRTVVDVEFTLTQAQVDEAESQIFKTAAYAGFFVDALKQQLDASGMEVTFDEKSIERIVGKPGSTIRAFFQANPDRIGTPVEFELAASSRVDGYFNGRVSRDTIQDSRFLMAADLDLVDALEEAGILRSSFNWTFITGADSGVDNPGAAGIGASVIGSFFMMLVVLVLSLPIGVAASIYLEEFAPQNRFTDLIEVNISNLAAVPSIVFGILGLAVFIQFAHLPQSAPLVGGLVLTLMTLPTIIISTRASLRAVPPSIRDAALGVGASKMPDRHDHRPRAGAGRDRAASAHRHGGLCRARLSRRTGRGLHGPQLGDAGADLYLGRTGGCELLRKGLGRYHRAPGVPSDHEHPRDHPAPPVRAPLVKREPNRCMT